MKRFGVLIALIIGLALPAMSQTLTVGMCKSQTNPYTTIQAAVNAAPAYATVQVCPGTYQEQVVITKPMTLKGLSMPPLGNPMITGPAGGAVVGPIQPDGGGNEVASLIAVDTEGSQGWVYIQGIVVDGSYGTAGNVLQSGITFISTNGSVTNSVIRNFIGISSFPTALWAENNTGGEMTLNVRNNVIDNGRGWGISASNGPSAGRFDFQCQYNAITNQERGAILTTGDDGANFSYNTVQAQNEGLVVEDASTVAHNTFTASNHPEGGVGIDVAGTGASIVGNMINLQGYMIGIKGESMSGGTITNNIINGVPQNGFVVGTGITVNKNTSFNIQSNVISNAAYGVDLQCNALKIGSSNTFFNIGDAFYNAPKGFAASGTFGGVGAIQSGQYCP